MWLLPFVLLAIDVFYQRAAFGAAAAAAALAWSLVGWRAPKWYWTLRPWELRRGAYRRLGVKVFGLFVIHGRIMNKVVRRLGGEPPRPLTRAHMGARADNALMSERIHVAALLGSLPLIIAAAVLGLRGWVVVGVGLNVIANVYPILLQRSMRGRMARAAQGARS
jgi:hypothetical protein